MSVCMRMRAYINSIQRPQRHGHTHPEATNTLHAYIKYDVSIYV